MVRPPRATAAPARGRAPAMRISTAPPGLLEGGGATGALMRAHPWSSTPLGDPAEWPSPLAVLVPVILASRQPMCVIWGPDRRLLYNDGYAAILGERHPAALGEPFAVVWPDLTEVAASVLDRVYDGEALQVDDTTFSMIRNGQPEEVHFNYSATPVRDEAGRVNGIFCVCMETTAAARMQAAAQAERERLEALWQQAPGEVVITRGPEHLIEFANAAYLEGVGNRPVIGKTARQAVPELEGQGLFELLDEVYRTGEPFVGRQVPITLHRAPGGEPFTRYADFVYQPITDEAGAVTGIFVQGHDVTDAKASQAALQESEARFRLFSEESREGVVLHDGDTILDCNPAYARMFGFDSMADAVGRPILDTLSQESIPVVRRKIAERFEEPFEVVSRRKDGSTLPCEIVARETVWRGQRVRIVLARDLTLRKQRELALRQSQRRFQTIADALPGFAWTADQNGQIDFVSQRWTEYSGADSAGSIRDQWLGFIHPDDLERTRQVWGEALATERPYETEFRLRARDGSYRWWLARALPVQDEGGPADRTMRWIGTCTDIHERKRAEEHQRLLINELNHRVKNTLATVQSLAMQSFRELDDASRSRITAFEQRLFALSKAHDVLTRENWEGAELRAVLDEVIGPYLREGPGRIEMEGPPLWLAPRTTLSLSMAAHELATNAAKYGALSASTGRVAITWTVAPGDPDILTFRWQEQGGPVVSPPARRGFGTRLIERSLAQDLGGKARLVYDPGGVVCIVTAPLSAGQLVS